MKVLYERVAGIDVHCDTGRTWRVSWSRRSG